MPDLEDEEPQVVLNTVATGTHSLGPLLPQTTIEDVWDVALTGTVSDLSKRAYLRGMVNFAKFVLERTNQPIPSTNQEVLKRAAPFLPHVEFPLVSEYREKLRKENYAARTINLQLAAIDKLFTRMMRIKLIDRNPASSELVPRMHTSSVSETEALTHGEAENILTMLYNDKTFTGIRDTALFAVFIHNGLRRSEIIKIDAENIKFVNDTPTVRLTIKRGKDITIEFIPTVWAAIDRWVTAAHITEGPIFRRIIKSKQGTQKILKTRLTQDGIYAIIKSRIRKAGITKSIHPHSLRHTYATLALLAGVPIQDVQVSMGHSSTETTFRYYRAIEQVGRSPGRSLSLNWPGGQEKKE